MPTRKKLQLLQLAIAERDFYSELMDYTYSTLTADSSSEAFDLYGKISEKFFELDARVKLLKRDFTKPNMRKSFIKAPR